MKLRVRSGTLTASLGVAAAGVQVLAPEVRWVGWVLIFLAIATFFFDVHFEGSKLGVGDGPQNFRGLLAGGAKRLRDNWLTAVLLAAAVGLSPFVAQAYLTSPRGEAPTPEPAARVESGKPAPGLDTPTPERRSGEVAETPRHGVQAPDRHRPLPAPAPIAANSAATQSNAQPSSPELHGGEKAPPTEKPDPPKAPLAVSEIDPVTQARQVADIRRHREEGDEVFDQLNKADTLEKVQAAMSRARAWDRKGLDMVGDYWGPPVRTYYRTQNPQNESYFYPDYMRKLPTEAFFQRKEWMNIVRMRQINLGEIAADPPKKKR